MGGCLIKDKFGNRALCVVCFENSPFCFGGHYFRWEEEKIVSICGSDKKLGFMAILLTIKNSSHGTQVIFLFKFLLKTKRISAYVHA